MRTHRRRRYVAAVLAALSVPLVGSTAALAVPSRVPAPRRRDAATAVHFAQSGAKIGDTPAEFGQSVAAAAEGRRHPERLPGRQPRPGVHPPTTIEVVRPERTIVRDTDPALPIILGGARAADGARRRRLRDPPDALAEPEPDRLTLLASGSTEGLVLRHGPLVRKGGSTGRRSRCVRPVMPARCALVLVLAALLAGGCGETD